MENFKNAERYSFHQLIGKDKFNIEIPIIQRDYAQGRDSQQELRGIFLKALYKYLEDNLPNRDLDFVYGYVTERKDFVPLDGQQRLTTLFLLHWYLAKANNDGEYIRNVLSNGAKSKFVYRTRFSSTDFCEALLKSDINIDGLKAPDQNKQNSLSKTIINKGWFHKYWRTDATVMSMLNMLDDIHMLFKDKPHFYQGLISEQPIITFLFLDLDQLKQGDDLYIKMNSRGKPLTNFENFKARFELEIVSLFGEVQKGYYLPVIGKKIECSTRQYFSYKIDCVWTDLFWNYRGLVGNHNTYDDELMNFIKAILTFSYIEENSFDKSALDKLLGSEQLSFDRQRELNLFTRASIIFLIETLDTLMNGTSKPVNAVTECFYFDFEAVFTNVLKNTATIPERILIYAYISYQIKYPAETLGLQDWMRVMANLVENTRFDTSEHFYSAVSSLRKLLNIAPTILSALCEDVKVDFFYADQVYEERLKASAILSDRGTVSSWEGKIYNAEKAVFHKGQIGYLLEFSGIHKVYSFRGNMAAAKESFDQYLQKFKALFSILGNDRNKNFILERALLTFGNYLLEASNWRYNFSSSKRVANYERDYSWKRILRVDFANLAPSKRSKAKRLVFQALVDSDLFDYAGQASVDNSLAQMIKHSGVLDWRKDFIDDPRIIARCGQGYIYSWAYNHRSIQLLNASQMNHLRYDLNTYVVYHNMVDANLFGPFSNCVIEPAKGYGDATLIILSNWSYKCISYKLFVEYTEEKYYLTLAKAKGVNKPEEYGDTVRKLLEQSNFHWQEYGYEKCSTSRGEMLVHIKNLLDDLNQLQFSLGEAKR